MVKLESKVGCAAQEDEAVEIYDGVVETVCETSLSEDDERDEKEGRVYA